MICLPVYEYKCVNEHTEVVTVSIKDEVQVPEKCVQCGEDLVRLFGTPSLKFNGTGWGKD
jgi:hypothetical protein